MLTKIPIKPVNVLIATLRKQHRLGRLLLASISCITSAYGISETNVLVVYNSESTDSQAVYDYYLTKRPDVRGFDLADDTIITPTISYADYGSKIRDPIRNYLNTNSLQQTVQVIVLTKDIPHRIQSLDLSNPDIGDNATSTSTLYNAGNATCASVDSELTLLQFDLETNEADGSYDSFADNAVLNPYFDQINAFSSYSRSSIDDANRVFYRNNDEYTNNAYGWWQLGEENTSGSGRFQQTIFTAYDAGHIYLTARLDADNVQDVKDMIDRAQNITLRSDVDAILLDSDGGTLDDYAAPFTGSTISDYSATTADLSAQWLQLQWNDDSTFLIGSADTIAYTPNQQITGPVAHLHSYGVNHTGTGNKRDYLATFEGQLVNGASFSAYESFGARGLGGLGNFSQAQVEEWISAGGTFATGPVWEPFTIGILKSEIFLDRFLNQGFTYVEAAWASILQLSWQSVVLGDPLATATVVTASPYEQWIFSNTGVTPDINTEATFETDLDIDGLSNGIEYLLDLDPSSSDTDSSNLPKLLIEDGDQRFTFTLTDPVPTATTVSVEMSTTLAVDDWTTIATRSSEGTWTGSATVIESNTVNGNEVEITDNLVITTSKRFYRVSATLSE
ncbi:hypothetical protein [Lentimonas sp. CC19]|uniref:hypothetical protein n=1 Tax=Lentimonas sp. CC19 TaxID=2676097 RepID=UPI001A7F10DE|nr:hypothetical protein [Lentimonas sp. CC19]